MVTPTTVFRIDVLNEDTLVGFVLPPQGLTTVSLCSLLQSFKAF